MVHGLGERLRIDDCGLRRRGGEAMGGTGPHERGPSADDEPAQERPEPHQRPTRRPGTVNSPRVGSLSDQAIGYVLRDTVHHSNLSLARGGRGALMLTQSEQESV